MNKKKLLTASILLVLSLPVIASENYSKDAESYAKRNKVSVGEANLALNIETHKDEVLKIIESKYQGSIAGVYIKNSPKYTIVVRLKGKGVNSKREFSIGKSLPGVKVPVRFDYGAKATRDVAKGQIQKAQKLSQKYFKTVQIVSYNERTGNIDVEVNAKSSPKVSSKISNLQSTWNNQKVPLNIELVSYSIQPY